MTTVVPGYIRYVLCRSRGQLLLRPPRLGILCGCSEATKQFEACSTQEVIITAAVGHCGYLSVIKFRM
jgi:hypothetical protein